MDRLFGQHMSSQTDANAFVARHQKIHRPLSFFSNIKNGSIGQTIRSCCMKLYSRPAFDDKLTSKDPSD